MISKTFSRWERFYQLSALRTTPFVTNGQVVQSVMDEGIKKGRPSNAAADSIFLGLSWGIYKGRGLTTPKIENKKFGPASNGTASLLLDYPIANPDDLIVYLGKDYSGSLMTKTAGGADPASATEVKLADDGRTVLVDDANAGADAFIMYRYSPTAIQQRFLYEGGGDLYPGNNAPEVFGQVGCITAGIVYTDQYDATVNWNTVNDATVIRGGANGKLTTSGTGCICRGLRIHEVPSADKPWLGVTLSDSI
jgi:hypothetical protein